MFFYLEVEEGEVIVIGDNKVFFGIKVFVLINVLSVFLKWLVILVDGIYVI